MGVLEKNHAGQECYIVDYDEDLWFAYSEDQQEFTIGQWLKKAKPLKAVFFVLRLHPDALFPRGDKVQPYVAKSLPIDSDTFDPFKVSAKLSCEIHKDTYWRASEGDRIVMRTEARARMAMNALVGKNVAYEVWVREENNTIRLLEVGKF